MAKARITIETLDEDNNVMDEAMGIFEMDEDMHVYANINHDTNSIDHVGARPNDRK